MSDKINSILGVKLNLENMDEVCSILKELLDSSSTTYCISPINLELIMIAQKHDRFRNFINNSSNLNTVDGVGIINVLKWYGIKNINRVCGSDLAYKIAEICKNKNKKYFILGADEEVSSTAKSKLQGLYPGLDVKNYSPPYIKSMQFSKEENEKIMDLLREYKPDVLCVAFGAPKQELWIDEHQEFLNTIGVKIAIGLGGSFDFIAGKIDRAPEIFQKTGNEWLYRLVKEPKSRFKRQIKTIPKYYWLCFLEYVKMKIKNKKGMHYD